VSRAFRGGRAAALVLAAAAACAPAAVACPPLRGGEAGSVMQLRDLRFGDDQVSILFGLRSGGARYGIPPYEVERTGDVVRVRIPGARLTDPDGLPSYYGERTVSPPGGSIHEIGLSSASDGGVEIAMRVSGSGCPRVLARPYVLGTTNPAAMLSVALRDGPAVALDLDHGLPGYAMQVVGVGLTPSIPVSIDVDGRPAWTSRSDANGHLDTVLFVPALPPGPHRALIHDPGRSVIAHFRVDEPAR